MSLDILNLTCSSIIMISQCFYFNNKMLLLLLSALLVVLLEVCGASEGGTFLVEFCTAPDITGLLLSPLPSPFKPGNGATTCAMRCFKHVDCQAFIYTASASTCALLSGRLNDTTGYECSAGQSTTMIYGGMDQMWPPDIPLPAEATWCHSVLNPSATGGSPFDFLGIFESSSHQHISKIKMDHDTIHLRGFQMEFGAGYLAATGSTIVKTLCEFAANEVIKEVIVETSPYSTIANMPARITFITSLQSCTGGPEGTADTFTYSGQRLLYAKGRVGSRFDQISFIFSRC